MPDFPSELVEAAAKALASEWHMVSKDLRARWDSVLPDDNPGVPENWLARAVLATVVPLIQQAERDRLAKQAGEPPPRPHIFSGFAGRWVAVEDAERWAACGVAAERERVREAITRLADAYAPNGTFLPTASILSLLSSPAEPTPHADNANAAIREARNLPPSEKGAMANRCDHGITLRQHRGVEETCVECGAKIRADVAGLVPPAEPDTEDASA